VGGTVSLCVTVSLYVTPVHGITGSLGHCPTVPLSLSLCVASCSDTRSYPEVPPTRLLGGSSGSLRSLCPCVTVSLCHCLTVLIPSVEIALQAGDS